MNVANTRKKHRWFFRTENPFGIQSTLIRNESAVRKADFQKITMNIAPGAKTRVEKLEGRDHVVVPMVMMVEGVHAGSGGPIFYPWEEMSKTPEVWNQKPVVVYHPDGSACDPDVVNNRKIGVIMNTKADAKGKRLPAEAWLERNRADAVDPRIFKAIDNNEMMELSTGVFVDAELTPGEWNGEQYSAIARNLRSDHLALLPDKIGACSINDGAGLLRNEMKQGRMDPKSMLRRLTTYLGLTDNEMSHENLRAALQTAIRTKLNKGDDGPWTWVEAVYGNFFVYDDGQGKLFRLGYSTSDTGVTLSDETPVEVRRVTEFRTVDGATFVGNQDQTTTRNDDMNRIQKIAAILAANIGWSESKALEGFSDKQIDTIHNGITQKQSAEGTPSGAAPAAGNGNPAPATAAAVPSAQATQTAPASAPTANAKPATVDEWMKSAPPEIALALTGLLQANQTEEAALIDKITKNQALDFKVEDLKGMPISNLRKLAKLSEAPQAQVPAQGGFVPAFVPPQPNFAGMAPAAPVANENGKPEPEAPLPRPVMNFRRDAEKGKGTAAAVA